MLTYAGHALIDGADYKMTMMAAVIMMAVRGCFLIPASHGRGTRVRECDHTMRKEAAYRCACLYTRLNPKETTHVQEDFITLNACSKLLPTRPQKHCMQNNLPQKTTTLIGIIRKNIGVGLSSTRAP